MEEGRTGAEGGKEGGGGEGDIWISVTEEECDFWSSCAGMAGAQRTQSGGKAPKRS